MWKKNHIRLKSVIVILNDGGTKKKNNNNRYLNFISELYRTIYRRYIVYVY